MECKKKIKKKGGVSKRSFLSDSKHSAVGFDKMLKNTKKEIKSSHDFSPRKGLLYILIFGSKMYWHSLHRPVAHHAPHGISLFPGVNVWAFKFNTRCTCSLGKPASESHTEVGPLLKFYMQAAVS